MKSLRRFAWVGATCLVFAATLAAGASDKNDKSKDQEPARPKLTLKAQPQISISPARITLTAELTGGANDFEEFYCPTIEWDWGDETTSEATNDCDPYQAGKSEIKRRFTVQHIYQRPGRYQVYFRLKRHDKVIAGATTTLQVRPGLGDPDTGR